jgi:hypothetical protein
MNLFRATRESRDAVARNLTTSQLSEIAKLTSLLAKQLPVALARAIYKLKADAISALILAGQAVPLGGYANGILTIKILTEPPFKLHVRRSDLQPEARIRIAESNPLPALAQLSEHLAAKTRGEVHVCLQQKGASV